MARDTIFVLRNNLSHSFTEVFEIVKIYLLQGEFGVEAVGILRVQMMAIPLLAGSVSNEETEDELEHWPAFI